MTWKDEKIHLDAFAQELINNDGLIGFMLLKIDQKTSQAQTKPRLNNIINLLNKIHKIETSRFRILLENYTENETMYYIVPKSEVPDCENCLISSTDDKFKELVKYFNKK